MAIGVAPYDAAAQSDEIPADFPHFEIAGRQAQADALRHLFWHHSTNLRPMATLWDEWLLPPDIWPAYQHDEAAADWRSALLGRNIDGEGYVATHQHGSIAHQRGWPFPGWHQSPHNFGWHFSFDKTVGPPWRPDHLANPDDFLTTGIESRGLQKEGWLLKLTAAGSQISPPAINHDALQAPFLQVRWKADNLGERSTPFIEWMTKGMTDFVAEKRMYFDPPAQDKMVYSMVPMYRHPGWRDQKITRLRLNFDNATTGAEVILQGVFPNFDTRHNVNNPAFVSASVDYFFWTRDLNFLRANIERMRLAMRFMETEFGTDKDGVVTMPWVGHEGTAGLIRDEAGKKVMRGGVGVGNNYWDLMPFGKQDSYATIRHYGAALKMAALEEEIARRPQWNIPQSPLMRSADHWRKQAALGRENGNRLFWNKETGRFTLGIDAEGNQADYGFTFLNLEAIAYDFATPEHARSIMDWLNGRRSVATDTSQTTDIYKWRFAPRATTKRNVDHYGWFWNGADGIPFGDQVQDGGAVLGFSYHDIMARLKVHGADDAAQRLTEIAKWYAEVRQAGGYRSYYDGSRPGTLQGAGTPGGLGLDKEFFESVMVPQVLVDGFLGLTPTADGFKLEPKLPSAWPSLKITGVTVHGVPFDIETTQAGQVTLTGKGPSATGNRGPLQIKLGDKTHTWDGTGVFHLGDGPR